MDSILIEDKLIWDVQNNGSQEYMKSLLNDNFWAGSPKKTNKTQTQDPNKSTQPSKTKKEFLELTHWKEIHNI